MNHIPEEEFDDLQKIILIGDAGTGKTNIIYCFTKQKAPNQVMPTVAIEFSSKIVLIDSQTKIKTQIWDTAGQQIYRSLTMNHYRNMNGAFIVFDVTKRSSFQHVPYWLQNLREKGHVDIQIGLLGHKMDATQREVRKQEAQHYANLENIFYAETTIKNIQSITSAFKRLLQYISFVEKKEGVKRSVPKLRQVDDKQGCSCCKTE